MAIGLCALFLLPAYFIVPSYVKPLLASVQTLLVASFYVILVAAGLVVVLVVALVAEKAYRRWVLGQLPPSSSSSTGPSRLGEAGPDEGPEALKRARRFTREARMDAVAERVIASFEQTTVGRELKRRTHTQTGSTPAKSTAAGKAGGAESIELRDLRSSRPTAATTARRRTPPPLPQR